MSSSWDCLGICNKYLQICQCWQKLDDLFTSTLYILCSSGCWNVNITSNCTCPSQDYIHADDLTSSTYVTPGFKPFTSAIIIIIIFTCTKKNSWSLPFPQFDFSSNTRSSNINQHTWTFLWHVLCFELLTETGEFFKQQDSLYAVIIFFILMTWSDWYVLTKQGKSQRKFHFGHWQNSTFISKLHAH